MKYFSLICIFFSSLIIAAPDTNDFEYTLRYEYMVYEEKEEAAFVLTIKNTSAKILQHKAYGYTAENFFAMTADGDKIKESLWLQGLRLKKMYLPPVSFDSGESKLFIYPFHKLYFEKITETYTVKNTLSKGLSVDVK